MQSISWISSSLNAAGAASQCTSEAIKTRNNKYNIILIIPWIERVIFAKKLRQL